MHVSNPRIALAAAVVAAFALSAGRADAAITHTVQDRTLTVTGDAAADLLTLRFPAADSTTLELDLGDNGTADVRVPRAQFDRIRVAAGAGDDRVRVDDGGTRAPATTPIAIDGQAGNDTLIGGRGPDELTGGDGEDVAEGNAGADILALGAGSDRATWDVGDGLDKFDGGAGFDSLTVNGDAGGEQLRALADGTRARVMRDGASIAYTTTLERIDLAALAGDDAVTIGDLTGTGVQEIRENGGAGADALTLIGTPGDDFVDVLANGSTFVLGLPAFVTIDGADAGDKVTIDGRGDDDRINGPSAAVAFAYTAIGGDGDDNLTGSPGADTLLAGDGDDFVDSHKGDDTIRLGAGDDILSSRAADGHDRVDGEAGRDAITYSGTSSAETFALSRAGARVHLDRATDQVDGGTMETVSIFSFGGADTMNFGDMTGTGVTLIDASLFDFAVPGGAVDRVRVDGKAGNDAIRVASASGVVNVTGLSAAVRLTGTDAAGDQLTVAGGDGDDRIDGADLEPAESRLFAEGGNGDDLLLGGAGDDVFSGNDGDDIVLLGDGDDVGFGGLGDDLLLGEGGDDVLDGGLGIDRLIGGPDDDVLLGGEVVTQD